MKSGIKGIRVSILCGKGLTCERTWTTVFEKWDFFEDKINDRSKFLYGTGCSLTVPFSECQKMEFCIWREYC